MALAPCSPQPQMVPMPWVPLYRWSQCSALPPPLQMASVYRLQSSLPKSISLLSNCKVRSLWEKRPCKESDHNPSKEVFSRAGHLPQILSAQGQVKAARSVQTPKATENFIWADPQPALLRKQEEGPALSEYVWHPTQLPSFFYWFREPPGALSQCQPPEIYNSPDSPNTESPESISGKKCCLMRVSARGLLRWPGRLAWPTTLPINAKL